MKKYRNECVGCKDLGLPCMGKSCPNINVIRHYCDGCGEEEKLYYFDNGEYCESCVLDKIFDTLDVVEGSER